MARTEVLYIRLTKEEKDDITRCAEEDFVGSATWARTIILRAVRKAKEARNED